MAYEYALLEKKDNLWIVTLNRPERMNALHSPAHKELDEIFNNFHQVKWNWVKAHNGNYGNEKADMLANKAINLKKITYN